MAEAVLLNDGWKFHMGELTGSDRVKKITNKAGLSGGASNLTREEGLVLTQPKVFTEIMKRDDGIYDVMGISDRLTGVWTNVNLPHDWMFRQPYKNQAISSTDVLETVIDNPGYFSHGTAYYRKVFDMPPRTERERVRLELDGVAHNCDVWLNGHYIGAHVSGYTGFSFDISEYLQDKNALLVRTDSGGNEGWWYEGAGIYRDVRLVVHNEISLQSDGLWVRVDEITDSLAKGKLVAELENASDTNTEVGVSFTIITPDNEPVYMGSGRRLVPAFSKRTLELEFKIDNPELWDLNTPVLYRSSALISDSEDACDAAEVTFGIRRIEYTRQGLFLNGKPVEIKGVCEHQDFAGVGTALTEDIMRYKVARFKEMGANAIRSSHNPMAKAMLDICDREGMLVLNENRTFSLNKEAREGLLLLVRDSRNHPCVFMYCLENEEFITLTAQGRALLSGMKSLVKRLDPTRPVTIAGQIAKGDPRYVLIADVAGFNYDDGDARIHLDNLPELRVMSTEDSSFASTRGVYSDNRKQGWCSCHNNGPYTAENIDPGTIGGVQNPGMLGYAWRHYKRELPELGGVFIWTGMDYRGESYPWYWPSVSSQFGVMDLCGFPKDQFWFWRSVWRDEPSVHVLPHWSRTWREGQRIPVETYSNCEEVELFISGVSQGRRKSYTAEPERWEAEYRPGEIKVIGYNGGKVVAEKLRRTFGEAHEIRLEPVFKGESLVLVKAIAYDADGNFCETADICLSFMVTNGKFIGCGNGNPASHEDDTKPERRLFNGLALVIVKPNGDAVLTAKYKLNNRECESKIKI